MPVNVCSTVFALLTLAVPLCLCTLPAINPVNIPFKDEERVCHESYKTVSNLFRGNGMLNNFVPDGITIKPAKVPEDSPCYGMQSTCCLRNEEKRMMPLLELEYHQVLKNVLQRRLNSCSRLGRNTERAMYQDIFLSYELLQTEISGEFGKSIGKEFFQDFFQFLYRFIHVRDFCQLSQKVEQQMKKLYRYFAENVKEDGYHNLMTNPCSEKFEKHFIDTWINSSLNSLVHQFNNLRLMSEVFELTQSLLSDIKQHKFNHQCVDSLFRLRHCSYCVGNHYSIPVCDGHCINTIRGCMVDLYELRPHVTNLRTKLKTITTTASNEMSPFRFLKNGLMEFVQFIRHLKMIKMSDAKVVSNETCVILDDTIVSQVEQDWTLHHLTATEQKQTNSGLKQAIEKEFECFMDIESVLSELDEEMCDINPKHIKYIRNKGCWNGTHSKGSYEEAIVGKARKDQKDNPAFRSFPSNNSYANQISQINMLIHEINQTNNFYECLKTDDEDCQLFLLECKANPPIGTNSDEPHLGSGSGSGSGWDHSSKTKSRQPFDTESSFTQSILIRLGGPRRYNDHNNEKNTLTNPDPDTNIIINEVTDEHNRSDLYTTSNDSDIGNTNQTGYSSTVSSNYKSTSPTLSSQTPTGETHPSPDPQTTSPDRNPTKIGSSGSAVYNSIFILLCTLFLCYLSL